MFMDYCNPNDTMYNSTKHLSYYSNIFHSKSEEISFNNDYKPIDDKQEKTKSKLNDFSKKGILIKENENNIKEIKSENNQNTEIRNSTCFISPDLKNDNLLKIKELEKKSFTSGRKRKDSRLTGNHNKFSDDNIRKKVKHLVLKNLLMFINDKIKEIYKFKIGKGIFIKQLLTINQKQKTDATILFNQKFLDKSIGDIFSEDISTKYTVYPLSHNRELINLLLKDEDNNRRFYFNKLFKLSFRDSLKHFSGRQEIEELKGMKKFDSIKQDFENDEDYLNLLQYYVMNFENIIKNRRARRRKIKSIIIEDNKNQ